jgi:Protein of unknown function (DUF1194)
MPQSVRRLKAREPRVYPLRLTLPACLCAWQLAVAPSAAIARDGTKEVDAEVVIAVDVSYSMDREEQRLQRAGYIAAITSPDFLAALKSGPKGRVALAYMEWAGATDQEIVMPWTLIDGPEAAEAFAHSLAEVPLRRASRTSISGGIDKAAQMFVGNGFKGSRLIIDVSGDGPNNSGRLVTEARDEATSKGIVINGLPLVDIRPYNSPMDIQELDIYYADCVIGGPGAFMIPINSKQKFIDATRTKLVLEVSVTPPLHSPLVTPTNAAAPRISCSIGETLWQRWRSN